MRCLQTPKQERVVQGRISNNCLVHGGDKFSYFLLVCQVVCKRSQTPQEMYPKREWRRRAGAKRKKGQSLTVPALVFFLS